MTRLDVVGEAASRRVVVLAEGAFDLVAPVNL